MNYRSRRRVSRLAIYLLLLLVAAVILLPFFWMVSTAFKPSPEILRRPPGFLPEKPTLEHFRNVFKRIAYFRNLYNSLFISSVTTVITIFTSTMVGYAMAKFRCVGLNLIFILILTGLMIPPFTIAIPLYIVAAQIGGVNTLWAVIIPFAVSNFGIFLMRQYCMGVPDDLIAAARIDGAGEFAILMRIVFPVVATGCAALGILKFLMTWNDFFWPLIMLSDDRKKTLQVVIATMIDFEYYVDFGLVMAATTLVVLPVIVLFLFFQKHIIEGVAISGMKG
ncbi:MAG: carbohydrate ABC transporter permease [Spirochaetales bacterium]|nr:carbohydrate ABC transporter permease [Spirochaetales bacterium]